MDTRMTRKRWLVGAGAGSLLLLGGIAAGPVASLAGDDPEATLSAEQAIDFAIAAYPGTTASDVEYEAEDGLAIYEVTLSNGLEVEVDGNSGAILETEPVDGDDEGEDDDRNDNDNDNDNDDNEADDDDADDNDGGNGEQEVAVPAGTLDDGAKLLPQATITLEQAITAAQGAAEGAVGEVDLEYVGDRLAFNVDIGDSDVKVDAADGSIISVDSDD